jgi:hypothetical protein
MATTDVFDARNGLSPELIAELRAAHLVVLGLKDERTAVARIEVGERVRRVILPAVVHVTHGSRLSDEKPLIIRGAQKDLLWQKAVDVMGPGDVATIEWALGWAAVSIVFSRQARHPSKLTPSDFRRLTVPLPLKDVWPGVGPGNSPLRRYSLGHTALPRRWRVGQPMWVRGVSQFIGLILAITGPLPRIFPAIS